MGMLSPLTGAPSMISYLWTNELLAFSCLQRNSLGYGLVLMEGVRTTPGCFSLDDCNFHVFDFYANQEEVDLPHNDVF